MVNTFIKWKKYLLLLVFSFIILFRFLMPVFFRQFGFDDAISLLKIKQFVSCMPDIENITDDLNTKIGYVKYVQRCGELPLVSLQSRLGLYFSPFILYWFIFLYWISNFNFMFVNLVNSFLLLLSYFLFYQTIKFEVKNSKYMLLLALSSPLAVTFSLMENMSWLIVISSVIFYLLKPRASDSKNRQFLLGFILGIAVSSHIQLVPLIIAIYLWQLISFKKNHQLIVLSTGILIPIIIYLALFFSSGKFEHIRMHVDNFTSIGLHILLTFNYVFRFMGIHPTMAINSSILLKNIETIIANLFLILNFLLSFIFFLKIKNYGKSPWFIQLIYMVSIIFIPLGLLTNGGSEAHESLIYWWFTPLTVGYIANTLFPKRGKILLIFLISVNTTISLIQYCPKIFFGSTDNIHGPSIISTLKSIDRLCESVDKSGNNHVVVFLNKESLSQLSIHAIPAITIVRNTDCAEKIMFTNDKQSAEMFL